MSTNQAPYLGNDLSDGERRLVVDGDELVLICCLYGKLMRYTENKNEDRPIIICTPYP
jgi:hypothetical protein